MIADHDISVGLAPIRTRFLQELKHRHLDIQNHLEIALKQDAQMEPAFVEIAAILHKIAGAAGTLGWADLGDKARAVEYQITDAKSRGHVAQRDLFESILDFLELSLPLTENQS